MADPLPLSIATPHCARVFSTTEHTGTKCKICNVAYRCRVAYRHHLIDLASMPSQEWRHNYALRAVETLLSEPLGPIRRTVRWYWDARSESKSVATYNIPTAVRRAHDEIGDRPLYYHDRRSSTGTKPYRGESCVLIDDVTGYWPRFSSLLDLFSDAPTRLPVRGIPARIYTAPWKATDIWVVSTKHPRDIYSAERYNQLRLLIWEIECVPDSV